MKPYFLHNTHIVKKYCFQTLEHPHTGLKLITGLTLVHCLMYITVLTVIRYAMMSMSLAQFPRLQKAQLLLLFPILYASIHFDPIEGEDVVIHSTFPFIWLLVRKDRFLPLTIYQSIIKPGADFRSFWFISGSKTPLTTYIPNPSY